MSPEHTKVTLIGKSRVVIGRFTYGFETLSVRQWGEGAHLSIGSFCSIASGITVFLGGNHRIDWVTTFPFGHVFQSELGRPNIGGHPSTKGNVIIGNDVWIGSNTTIMSGVTIGHGAIISANAHVVKNVNPYEIVGGNPAKKIKQRFDEAIVSALLKLRWWDLRVPIIRELIPILLAPPSEERILALADMFRNDYETEAQQPEKV